MAQLNKDQAYKIQKKLGGQFRKGDKSHERYEIFHEDQLICHFGIRRGSRRDQGHGHIPKDIFVSPHYAQELANCQKSRDQWIEKIKADGKI